MSHKITLTVQTVQLLFSAATACQWPRRLGNNMGEEERYNLEWTDRQRSDMSLRIAKFRSKVRGEYAEKKGNDWVVGSQENWALKPDASGRYEAIDRYKLIELELDDEEHSALYPLCLWLAHPASPGFKSAWYLDEMVIPLVEELGEYEQLRYDLGLREDEPTKAGSNGQG